MIISRFNESGIDAFRSYLQELRIGARSDSPVELINDSILTESIDGASAIETDKVFARRYELAEYISERLPEQDESDDMADTGLWAWLSAAYFDSVCPKSPSGYRAPKNDYRHIPSTDWRHFYRHLVRGPVRIYRLFRENIDSSMIVLCQHPASPGDFVEQLAARQERVTNPSVIEAANHLYYDSENGKAKRGSAPNWAKPGTLRRFQQWLDQMDLTYDLYSMTAEDILAMLPSEFNPYLHR